MRRGKQKTAHRLSSVTIKGRIRCEQRRNARALAPFLFFFSVLSFPCPVTFIKRLAHAPANTPIRSYGLCCSFPRARSSIICATCVSTLTHIRTVCFFFFSRLHWQNVLRFFLTVKFGALICHLTPPPSYILPCRTETYKDRAACWPCILIHNDILVPEYPYPTELVCSTSLIPHRPRFSYSKQTCLPPSLLSTPTLSSLTWYVRSVSLNYYHLLILLSRTVPSPTLSQLSKRLGARSLLISAKTQPM
jgi:hypothetical protein